MVTTQNRALTAPLFDQLLIQNPDSDPSSSSSDKSDIEENILTMTDSSAPASSPNDHTNLFAFKIDLTEKNGNSILNANGLV